MPRPGFPAWSLVSLLLAIPAAWLGWHGFDTAPSWCLHPALGLHGNPLSRYWSSAWVHSNAAHLLSNLAGLALLLGLAWVYQLPARAALAWLAAWPLTHIVLLLDPRLDTYWGMSGVLHAGMAVIAITLIAHRTADAAVPRARTLGWSLLTFLVSKVWLENPQLASVIPRTDLAMNVAPIGHLAGLATGATAAMAASIRRSHRQSPPCAAP